jgi:hypothetical protein
MKRRSALGLWAAVVLALCPAACSFDIANLAISGNNAGVNKNAFGEVRNFAANAHWLIFGTSTKENGNNSITIGPGFTPAPENKMIPAGTVNIKAEGGDNNNGKIAGSEDGITFLFKEVEASKNFIISADFTIISFGGSTLAAANPNRGTTEDDTLAANGQEGWGLMARDFVPQYPGKTMEEIKAAYPTPAARNTASQSAWRAGSSGGDSNMVMVGGVKRGARVYWRYGVRPNREITYDARGNPATTEYMDASMSKVNWLPRELGDYSIYTNTAGTPTLAARPDFPPWGSTYKLVLEKDNNKFTATITPPPEKGVASETYTVPLLDILTSVNPDRYYVGIFTSRAANVNVTNIKYYEADAADCPPAVDVEPEKYTPTLEVISPSVYTGRDYIYVKSNVEGTLAIKQNGREIPPSVVYSEWITEPTNAAAVPFTLFTIPTYPHENGDNVFSMMFYPDSSQTNLGYPLTSNAAIHKTFAVTKKVFPGDVIYVSPGGLPVNDGSSGSPLDLDTAIASVQPGQTIIMKNGVYTPLSVNIPRYNDGRHGKEKTLKAETRNQVFIDFKKNKDAKGFVLAGSYWKIKGIHVRNTPDKVKGVVISGNNNTISWVSSYNHGDTGMQISGNSAEAKSLWPSNNLIEYCESYNNRDAAEIDADGFAAKLTVGEDNRFEWCVSHNNCDDGWDLFTKKETGAIGVVTISNCIAYFNGTMMNGRETRGGKNGYKLGGEGIPIQHRISNSLSFANGGDAITSNSNPAILVEKCNAFPLGAGNVAVNIYSGDKSPPTGKAVDTLTETADYVSTNYSSIVVNNFIARDPATGKFNLGDVFKPKASDKGAWELYGSSP